MGDEDFFFKEVADAALQMAHVLLPQWIGGRRVGNEWHGERKANGGLGDSWKVNLLTGEWAHFGGDEKGGDLISIYAALNHINQAPARDVVAGLVGHGGRSILPFVKPSQKPPETIPDEPPPVPAHPKFGEPTATYRYEDAFVVARFDHTEGKTFLQFTWRDGRWVAKGHPAPLPLYRRLFLQKYPNGPVLVVEGEKCAETAQQMLRRYVVLTWAGGASAVKKSDWTPLAGRDVIIWPDADEPGAKAAATIAEIIANTAARVRVINPNGAAPGWDIADAVAEGWDAKKITTWATEHIKVVVPAQEVAPPAPAMEAPLPVPAAPQSSDSDSTEESVLVNWATLGLKCNDGGTPHPTMGNASQILRAYPKFAGHVWFDTFQQGIFHDLNGAVQKWRDGDDLKVCAFVQQTLSLSKFTSRVIREAVQHAAEYDSRNPLVQWLDSLNWDGTERLDYWLSDCLGCERSDYTTAVARNWPISMIARAYKPGCQVDTMPVLEGPQGRGKSSFLEVLGGPWYGTVPVAFGDKDFLQAIQGRWLIEIPDMTGFSRREHTQILATITTRTDIYRASYGRYTESHPRVAIFAATTETDTYLQDLRGRRRYLPLRCGAIDLTALRAQREQIFAEAVRAYKGGATWHLLPASADIEQRKRASIDAWADKALAYASRVATGGKRVTIPDILEYGLELPHTHWGASEVSRVTRILRDAGWLRNRSMDQRFWQPPPKRVDFDDQD